MGSAKAICGLSDKFYRLVARTGRAKSRLAQARQVLTPGQTVRARPATVVTATVTVRSVTSTGTFTAKGQAAILHSIPPELRPVLFIHVAAFAPQHAVGARSKIQA
jgi:hypothetical protein